jgi:DNA-directed RNA polymerase specialized sigma24 family protein
MAGSDTSVSGAFLQQRVRLRAFVRKRVPEVADAEDILQQVLFELLEAARLMQPIEQAGAWLFRVARNRIADLFRAGMRQRCGRPAPPAESGTQA